MMLFQRNLVEAHTTLCRPPNTDPSDRWRRDWQHDLSRSCQVKIVAEDIYYVQLIFPPYTKIIFRTNIGTPPVTRIVAVGKMTSA